MFQCITFVFYCMICAINDLISDVSQPFKANKQVLEMQWEWEPETT